MNIESKLTDETVSIVMPAFNASEFIVEAIQSVLEQTYEKWELIVVDDQSTDGTRSLAEEAAHSDERIKVIPNTEDKGAAGARNAGIEAAKGAFIAFLDSDDIWMPTKLERQVQIMNDKDGVLCFTAYRKLYPGNRIGRHVIEVPSRVGYGDLLRSNVIGCSTAIYNCRKLGKVYFPDISQRQDLGLWLKILKRIGHEDYGFWLKILRGGFAADKSQDRVKGVRALGVNEDLVLYRIHSNSLSSNKFKAAIYQWLVYRDIEGLRIWTSWYYFFHYMVRGLKKHLLD